MRFDYSKWQGPRPEDAAFIKQHLQAYARSFVLDQGEEGACTGFGLATVANYLLLRPTRG